MMNPMHARRHDDQVQNPFDLKWQTPVRMVKKCRGLQCNKEGDQHNRRDAEDRHRKGKKSDRENHFAEMKSRCGRYIEVEVGVMHIMKPPEEMDHVVGPMPPPI